MAGETSNGILLANGAGIHSIAVTNGVYDMQKMKSDDPTWIADTFMNVINDVLRRMWQKSV